MDSLVIGWPRNPRRHPDREDEVYDVPVPRQDTLRSTISFGRETFGPGSELEFTHVIGG